MSRKTRNLIWAAPLAAVFAVVGALALFMTLTPNSALAQAEEIPGMPMDLTVMAISPTSLELSWEPPADSTGGTPDGYRIDYSNDGDVWYALEPNYSSTVYTDDDGLKAKQMRYYRIFAFNSSGHSGVLGPVGAETQQSTKPDAVDDLALDVAAPTQEMITLTWTAPDNPEGASVTEYRIQSSKNGRSYTDLKVEKASMLCDGDTCTYEDKNLLESTKRWYQVYASNSVGESDASNGPSATTAVGRIPTVPQNLRAGLNPAGRMWLYWDEPADGTDATMADDPPGAPILGYYIQGGPVKADASGAVDATTFRNPKDASATVDGQSPNKNVLYYVEASTDLALTTSVLSKLDDFAGAPGRFDLNDPATPDDATDDTVTHWGFRVLAVNRVVQRNAEDGVITDTTDGVWTELISVNHLAVDTPEDGDTTTTEDDVDNLLSRPTLKAKRDTNVNGGRTNINLEWSAARSIATTSYRVEVSEDRIDWEAITILDTSKTGDLHDRTAATIADGTGKRTLAHDGLTAGTTYYYRVFAQHTNATVGDPVANIFTESSLTVSETTAQADKPYPPTMNSVEAESETEIKLSWTRPGVNGSEMVGYGKVVGYHLEHSDDGHTWMVLEENTGLKKICGAAGTSETCSYTHKDLVQGQTKYYRVSTINNATRSSLQMSDPSDTLSATTQKSLASDDPGGLVAKAMGRNAIKLLWNARADDITAAPIIGYKIESSPLNMAGDDCAADWSVLEANTMSTTTSYEHTGLMAGTGMCYRIFGINVVATSSAFVGYGDDYVTTNDNDAIAMTDAAGVPGMPMSLTATAVSDMQIDLMWNAPADDGGSDITGYVLQRKYGDMDFMTIAATDAATWWNTLDCPMMNDAVPADSTPAPGADDMTSPYCAMYDGLMDDAKMVVDATFMANYDTITGTSHMDMGLMEMIAYSYQVQAANSVGYSMASATAMATTGRSNADPMAEGTIAAVTVTEGMSTDPMDVSMYFSDADPEDATLMYSASSDMMQYATASVSGSMVTITGVAPGMATITMTATDSMGETATQDIAVTVTAATAIRPTITDVSVLQNSISVTWDTSSNQGATQIKVALFDLDDNGDIFRLAEGYTGNVHTINPAVGNPGAYTFTNVPAGTYKVGVANFANGMHRTIVSSAVTVQ